MKHFKLFAVLISACATFIGPANAQQPPDNVVSDACFNTAMGTAALQNNTNGGSLCPGSSNNVASGYGALSENTTGTSNTAIGALALGRNTTGTENTASGYYALFYNSNGYANSAFGYEALHFNTDGYDNTASGYEALYNNDGLSNTAFGTVALYSNTYGNDNTAIGADALISDTIGNQNTAVGAFTLVKNTGSNNIALGYGAGDSTTTGSNNIDIGAAGLATDNGVIRIGTKGTHKEAFIEGIYTTALLASSLPVYVNSAGRLSVGTSSERYKTDIVPMGNGSEKLQRLRPVTFKLKHDPQGALQYGLIAEEVAKVYPDLVVRDESGHIQGVRYDELAPMLLNEMQKQRSEMTAQKEQMAAQDAKIQAQEQKLAKLEQVNESMHAAMAMLLAKGERVAMR